MMNLFSRYDSIVKQAGLWDLAKGTVSGSYGLAKDTLHNLNPRATDVEDTAGYSIAKDLTELLLPKTYSADNTGPYAEYTEFLKDTEEGDQLLRDAATLRRCARVLLRQKAEEEEGKRHAASSRYF